MILKTKIFQIDAFSNELFRGNPAAVCPLKAWLPDKTMQEIALENNLSETAFICGKHDNYKIRWFTPTVEVDLCGHATLAAGFVIFNFLGFSGNVLRLESPHSGVLKVIKEKDGMLTLDFPTDTIKSVKPPRKLISAIGRNPVESFKGKTDYMLVFSNQKIIEKLNPDFRLLKEVNARGIIVTAPGTESDFVSRFFAPKSGIDEDPVTGSAHTSLTPYWSKRLNKKTLVAKQLSSRQGILLCENQGARILISGHAQMYLAGEINFPV